jgi:uncharacterized surface protein with fasciclin (FAS1) repeats
MKAKIFLFFYVVTVLSAIVLATAIAQEQPPPTKQPPVEPLKDIVETASTAGTFNTFLKAVDTAGLKDTLKGAGPYTVFAPTDEAFAKLPAGELEALLKNKEKLKKVLLSHVTSGTATLKDAANLKPTKSLEGSEIKIEATEGKVKIGEANVVQAEILASNGIIHAIDTVILPGQSISSRK